MAGVVTVTEVRFTSVKRVEFSWASSAGGAADATTAKEYDGRVIGCSQEPGTGLNQPTNLYDVTVKDENGRDVLNGLGANLSNTAPTVKVQEDKLLCVAGEKLTLAVVAAGNVKEGKTVLWIR